MTQISTRRGVIAAGAGASALGVALTLLAPNSAATLSASQARATEAAVAGVLASVDGTLA